MNTFDPLLALSMVLIQVGSRHLDIELTEMQKKIIKDKNVQIVILFCIIYMSTRSILKSLILILIFYIFINILFNEKNKYNILSKKWLYKEGILKNYKDIKSIYHNNLSNLI